MWMRERGATVRLEPDLKHVVVTHVVLLVVHGVGAVVVVVCSTEAAPRRRKI